MALAQEHAVDYDPFAGGPLALAVPTTESQREIWLADQLSGEATLAFNLAIRLRLSGPLDGQLLERALRQVAQRHDSLRATFSADGEELLIAEQLDWVFAVHDLSELDLAGRQRTLDAAYLRAVETPFDLRRGPLFRAELWRLEPRLHVLLIAAHHIVCDGWSFSLLVDELQTLYGAWLRGAPDPLPPAAVFADYAREQAQLIGSHASTQAENYWLEQFRGSLPVLDLPLDRARPAMRSFRSRREDWILDGELLTALKRVGAQVGGASLFVTLLAAFQMLLCRLTANSEVIIGVPAAGQVAAGNARLVGHCVNLLALRLSMDPAERFPALLARTRGTVLDAYENQPYTFGSLLQKVKVQRDQSRSALVSVLFNVDQGIDSAEFGTPGLSLDVANLPRTRENFELFLNAAPQGRGLKLECQYNAQLFDGPRIAGWLEAFETLLRGIIRAPDSEVARLPILSAPARAKLDGLQPAATVFPVERLAHQWFERQASATPGRRAVIDATGTYTYARIEARANQIANALRARGIGRGALVGLAVSRGVDMPAAVLGTLKSGAGYVPLDPAFPAERLAYMVADAQISALIVDDVPALGLAACAPLIRLCELDGEDQSAPRVDGLLDARADSPAFVIYTSGSTGRPKGVVVAHAATANFLHALHSQPGMSPDDLLVAVTTLSFDIAFLELMLPLSVGAAMVIADRDVARDGRLLRDLIEQHGVSFMQATPAGWRLLLEAGFSGAPSFTALSGGEPLAADLAQALLERCGSVYNGYGPTETTVYSTMWRVADSEHGISIGRPLANTRVDIRDAQGELCLPGASGELWIGGAGVSEGYLRRPELTDERFVTADCANGQSMRFYRTGDRARWLANGTLQHLGRLDFQIKVRGYRIEPGEIEAQLLSVAGVARAIVVAREDCPGDTRLVAYYVVETGQNVTAADLRARLREALPEYMLPQHLVALEALPLLPNLKIDRKALPAPGALAGAAVIASAPRDDLERSVYAAMAQVLGNPKFSVQDNFFDLGGHSLLAAQLTSKLNRELGLNVPFLALFEAPSCAALAAWIRTSAACADPQISRRRCIPMCADRSRAPLSMMQQRIYFLEALHPGRVVYNTPSAHRLFGKFDEHAFEQAWREIIRRQPILRTAIVAEGEFAVQLIHAELPFSIFPAEDFSALAPAERELRLALGLDQFISEPFNLAHAPLFRVRMFKLGEEEHVMAFLAHHMIWDGGSFDLLFQELSALYAAYCLGQPSPLPELTRTYADFSVWQHDFMQGAELSAQLQHWTQLLQGALSPLELPLDRPRPPRMSGRAGNVRLRLDATLTDRARTLGRRADATLFMVLLTTYAVLLQRLTGQRDLIIATPVRGRDAEALDGIMGFFVNALPLRITLDPAHSFLQALSAVRASVLDGFTHPDVPLDHLVRALKLPRDESRTPIYQAFFAFQDARAHPLNWHELRQERIDLLPSGAAQDIGLWFVEAADGLSGGLNFNADIFDHTTIERHGERFMGLLIEALLAPEKAIARLPAVTPAELAQLQAWNQTAAPYQRELGMHGRFELQAARAPHATALYCAGQLTRYGELDAAANRIAHALIARGVGPGQRVGLCLARDQRLVAGLLGVLKTGAAYVPLDPDFPTARVNYMLADAAISQLISVAEFADLLDFPAEHTLRLDVDADALATQPTSRPALPINPDAPAYVIHTSGSTGQPKGVVVPHSALSNFLEAMQQKIGLRSSDRLLAVTTLSFDIAVLELLLPLSAGAQVVMASRETAMDGHALLELLDVSEATLMQATPASWRMLLEAGWTGARDFRVLCGGEALPPELASLLRTRCSEIYNLYGPTETTIWSTCWRVDRPEQGISIGTPIANTEVWVVDEFGELCAPGVPGELLIGGIGVTQGYFERPELSTERFVADRFRGGDSARLYRTGDRGRWLARGRLEHLGRLDHQVKVRGHRIELGEVESTIGMQPGIARVVVTAREDQPGDVRLVAYLKPQAGAGIDQAQLRKTLRQTLPDYMVPQHFVVLDEFPSLPNGKIDRAGLLAPQMVPSAALEHRRAAASPTERQLAALWAELLGADVIGADDNFFDLGGHSLLAMQAIARMFTTTGKRVNPRCYIFQTLAQIAQSYLETPAPVEPPGVLNRLMGMLRGTARSGNG